MAMAIPRWANSIAVARPRPVAPPVTTATRPWTVSARRCSCGRSSVAGAPPGMISRDARIQVVEVKIGEPMFEIEHRQGAAKRTLHDRLATSSDGVAYRFYAKFIARRVFGRDGTLPEANGKAGRCCQE